MVEGPARHRYDCAGVGKAHLGLARAGLGNPLVDEFAGPERRGGDRRSVVDRRSALDRRRGPGRRRTDIRREAEEGEMSGELLEFVLAIDEYKRVNNRPFPSWSEVFEVIRYLGYRKVADLGAHINEPASGDEPPLADTTSQPV